MGKSNKIRNKKHLQYVTTYICCLHTFSTEWCNGGVQAHHLLKPYDGTRGMGMKSGDNNAIPLCQYHHMLLHDRFGNEDAFWRSYGLDSDFGRIIAKNIWEKFLKE